MSEASFFHGLLVAVFALSVLVYALTGRITAPYGRHGRRGWGPVIPVQLAWVLMESPSVFVFALCFFLGTRSDHVVPLVLMAMWLTHYVHRAFIYPLRLKGTAGRTMPLSIAGMGFFYNLLNSYLNGRSLSEFGPDHGAGWLLSVPFLVGLALFVTGFGINRWADAVLRSLRGPGDTGYKIPRGGLYELVSCPNYFGEVLQWFGFAVASWSPAGLAFAVFTFANLVPRARSHHAWYRKQFDDYPKSRKAVIPFVV